MLANVARDYASYASGVLSIVRTFGQCLGAATVGVLLAATPAKPLMTGSCMLRCGSPS
jgi:DHA2 family multidrug resistance protein-like MFS transporter